MCSRLSVPSEIVYAVIQNGGVVNTIVVSQSFVDANYPSSPRIDGIAPQPGIGRGYDGSTWTAAQTFAIVTDGVVTQVVIGQPVQYPGAIRIDTLHPMPAAGWTYDGTTVANWTQPASVKTAPWSWIRASRPDIRAVPRRTVAAQFSHHNEQLASALSLYAASGKSTWKFVPHPSTLSAVSVAWWISAIHFAIASPSPVPSS